MDKKSLSRVRPALKEYVEQTLLPLYDSYHDQAHDRNHILSVIEESFALCDRLDLFGPAASRFGSGALAPDLVYAIAAWHDLGICEGREFHHIVSGRMLIEDDMLRQWFSEEERILMKEAVEDHRASKGSSPRSLYGKVVSEADKKIDPDNIIARTILFGRDHYPELSPAEQKARNLAHLHEKYGDGGYLKLQFDDSPNADRLEELRSILRDPVLLEEEYAKFEYHPLEPFLPNHARVLFLGSFPPPQARWCMNFYYPNWINDMWRILGLVFLGDKDALTLPLEKKFDYGKVVAFCEDRGIAIYDAARMVKREKGNASDKFLKILVPTDLRGLAGSLPECKAIVSTGGKSAETIAAILGCPLPDTGRYTEVPLTQDRTVRFYRLPSSSRAYPLSIDKKADAYRKMFQETGLLD